jgi:tetratricopeptide (TPR) repeat protein
MRRVPAAVPVALIILLASRTSAGQMRRSGAPGSFNTPVQDVTNDRIQRLKQWMNAVDRHEPGAHDAAVMDVGTWSNAELQGLWVDVYALAQLTRNLGANRFLLRAEGQRGDTEIRYTAWQIRQMRVFACAAAGILPRPDCAQLYNAASGADDDLVRLSAHAAAERSTSGDDNYLMRRAALLHADVAMLEPRGVVESFANRPVGPPAIGPQTWRIDISDGRGLDVGLSALHWDIARLALDQVRPGASAKPAPARDAMVRAWYRATAAWMQYREDHDTQHLDRARAIFPDDPDILFLSGCQRESYAAPSIQAATRTVTLPPGLTVGVGSDRAELRLAEGFFKRALAKQPDMGETHLRLGRVLGLEGRHADAAAEIRQAMSLLGETPLRYYGELFLGAEEEALGRVDAARDAFDRAAALFPSAQSPLIALSELAKRRGDRAGALAAIQRLFALPPAGREGRDDPWWSYHTAQARDADALLDALQRPFRRASSQ